MTQSLMTGEQLFQDLEILQADETLIREDFHKTPLGDCNVEGCTKKTLFTLYTLFFCPFKTFSVCGSD
jgi:hypothetical protein